MGIDIGKVSRGIVSLSHVVSLKWPQSFAASPILTLGWPCYLLWLVECCRSDVMLVIAQISRVSDLQFLTSLVELFLHYVKNPRMEIQVEKRGPAILAITAIPGEAPDMRERSSWTFRLTAAAYVSPCEKSRGITQSIIRMLKNNTLLF